MSILDKCRVEETRLQRPAKTPVKVLVTCEQIDENELAHHIARQFGFKIVLGVEVEFWANRAQYSTHRKMAERALLHKLYGEMLAHIDIVAHAVVNDDRETALSVLAHARRELIGGAV